MFYTIKNEYLEVTVNSFGAELSSVKSHDGYEYMWQGGKWWPDRAPVLFPTCGNVPGRKYYIGDKEYKLPIHGIAMYREFTLVESSEERLLFSQKSDEETLKSYPFEFELQVEFTLLGNTLITKLIPINTGSGIMPYMVGWHPGFNLPGNEEIGKFRVDFGKCDSLTWYPTVGNVSIPLHPTVHTLKNNSYYLNEEEIYKNDTMIFRDYPKAFSLIDPDNKPIVSMQVTDNIPCFCIWKEASSEARFVCLEPWNNIFTTDGSPEYLEKRKMTRLAPGERDIYTYKTVFHKR